MQYSVKLSEKAPRAFVIGTFAGTPDVHARSFSTPADYEWIQTILSWNLCTTSYEDLTYIESQTYENLRLGR